MHCELSMLIISQFRVLNKGSYSSGRADVSASLCRLLSPRLCISGTFGLLDDMPGTWKWSPRSGSPWDLWLMFQTVACYGHRQTWGQWWKGPGYGQLGHICYPPEHEAPRMTPRDRYTPESRSLGFGMRPFLWRRIQIRQHAHSGSSAPPCSSESAPGPLCPILAPVRVEARQRTNFNVGEKLKWGNWCIRKKWKARFEFFLYIKKH